MCLGIKEVFAKDVTAGASQVRLEPGRVMSPANGEHSLALRWSEQLMSNQG